MSALIALHLLCCIYRNVQSLVEQGQKGELTMQPGKSMMESLESSINKVTYKYCTTRTVVHTRVCLESCVSTYRRH